MRVSVGDVRLYFEVYGQGRGINRDASSIDDRHTLIGLHGGPGADGGKLRYLLPQLSDLVQVVVPDQRGHGLSDPGIPEMWNLAQWAGDVRAFSDALGIDQPIVLGESFGGFVAQEYAAAYPNHPVALILVSCGARFATPEESAVHVGGAAGRQVEHALGGGVSDSDDDSAWELVIEPLLRVRSDPALDAVNALRIRTPMVNQHFEPEGVKMDLRPRLANVRCPTLLIVGELDPLVPPVVANELIDALTPGLGRLAVIRNASHEVLTDGGNDAWEQIRAFLSDLP